MNLIKNRDARTKKRQKAKEKFDKKMTFALENDQDGLFKFSANTNGDTVRLLDEGAIVTAYGDLDLYLKKGVIEKYVNGENEYLENLTNTYEGTINIGHQDFATFPFIVGTWKKSDLTVTDNGEGRHGLDVKLNLNTAHPLVQALRVQDIPVGVSVEMYLHFDEDLTEEEGVPIVDEIFIADFAIVGECGNVGSSGSVDLQGVNMKDIVKDTELEEVFEDSRDDMLEEIAEENEVSVEDTETAEDAPSEEAVEEETVEDEPSEEEEKPEENEGVDEEAIEEAESEEDGFEEDALAVAEETINTLKAENQALKEQIEALKKSNNKKEKKIKEYAERNAEAAEKFKNLSVSIGLTKEVKETVAHKRYATGDGIGE